jgi:hypothetical protein
MSRKMTSDQAILDLICKAISSYGYRFNSEKQLHEGITLALTAGGFNFEREYSLDGNRFDFYFQPPAGIVIEAKIKGSMSEALRQSERYCQHPLVGGVLIVSTRATHNLNGTCFFNERPVQIINLKPQAF